MEEIVKQVEELLTKYGAQNVETKEEGEGRVVIELESPIKLSYENYYENFYNDLKGLGFYATNGSEFPLANYLRYKLFEGIDEFESDDRTDLLIYYKKTWTPSSLLVHVWKVEINFPSTSSSEEE